MSYINPQAAAGLQSIMPALQTVGTMGNLLSGDPGQFLQDLTGLVLNDALDSVMHTLNGAANNQFASQFNAQANFTPGAPGAQPPSFIQAIQNDIHALDDYMDQHSQTWQNLSAKIGL